MFLTKEAVRLDLSGYVEAIESAGARRSSASWSSASTRAGS
jgi:hypothetical protein